MKYAIVLLLISTVGITGVAAQNSGDGAPPTISRIDDLQRGEYATVQGEVVRYRDREEILLRDGSGRIAIYLGSPPPRQPVAEVGEVLVVSGWVDDDLFDIPKELYATEIIRADGTVIELAGRNEEWD